MHDLEHRYALQSNFNSVINQQVAFTLMRNGKMMPPVESQPVSSEEERNNYSQ